MPNYLTKLILNSCESRSDLKQLLGAYFLLIMENITIPLIDCSPIAEGNFNEIGIENFKIVAQQLGAAMTGIGMCYLINHGLDMRKIEKVYDVSTKFFELPMQTKLKYRKLVSTNGYVCPGDQIFNENTTELRESWDIVGLVACDEFKYPTDEIPEFKMAFDDTRNDLEGIGKKILRCIETFLNLEKDYLISKHKNMGDHMINCQTGMRFLNYYALNPNEKIPVNAIRCGEHKDWGTITLLIQDMVGGLEVKTSEGEWVEATPIKDAILMNSGALLEYWTGGRFHAAPHRVRIMSESRTTNGSRQSFVYFIGPDGDTEVFPVLPILPDKKKEFEKYDNKAIVACEHNQRLIKSTFQL